MSYSVRHQIFLSSTFTDLKDERAEVIQAVWEMDCIPTGMEAFVASNDSQWDVIKRVILECDYYVLIIGGRYGSVTTEGISYTEKEYRFAQEIGLPVLAFVHGNPEEIAFSKSESDDALRAKLKNFRDEVMKKYPVKTWSNAAELGGYVSRSLSREIKLNPRPGWIRNDGSSPIELLEQINKLTEENRSLRDAAAALNVEGGDQTFEQGEDEIELTGERTEYRIDTPWDTRSNNWSVLASWDDIFRHIGPSLISEASEFQLKSSLAEFNTLVDVEPKKAVEGDATVHTATWNDVLVQFRALGFIAPGEKKRGVNDRSVYWKITPVGDRHLVSLLARKRKAEAS